MSQHWRQPRFPVHRPKTDIWVYVVIALGTGVVARLLLALSV